MKKNTKLHLGISTEDKLTLQKRAESLGMGLSEYCLFVLKNAKPKIQIPV